MSTYTQYTGTFRKQDGSTRLMNYIKVVDLPKSMVSENTRKSYISSDGKSEIVYDVNANGFRTFNHGTLQGTITSKYIQKQFDKR